MWIFNSVPWFHLVKKGSHQCRGAFFTDSNELDPAVMTERSDPKRKWQNFFILTVSTGQETVSALSRSPMQCRIGLTFSTARKRCKNFSFLGRSHLAGRCVIWQKSSKITNFQQWFHCRWDQLATLSQPLYYYVKVGIIGIDVFHYDSKLE